MKEPTQSWLKRAAAEARDEHADSDGFVPFIALELIASAWVADHFPHVDEFEFQDRACALAQRIDLYV